MRTGKGNMWILVSVRQHSGCPIDIRCAASKPTKNINTSQVCYNHVRFREFYNLIISIISLQSENMDFPILFLLC
jgi:hypothetical protein